MLYLCTVTTFCSYCWRLKPIDQPERADAEPRRDDAGPCSATARDDCRRLALLCEAWWTTSRPLTPSWSGPAREARASQRHAELTEQLNDARWRYHVLDAPTISDGEFDAMMRELNEIEAFVP